MAIIVLCGNVTANSSADNAHDPDEAPGWITASVVIVGIVTILVNIPAIIAVIFTKIKSTNSRNLYLISLAITDLLAGVSLFPILITFIQPNVRISYWSCHLRYVFFVLAYFNSIGQVGVICIDRCCLLRKPSWRFTSYYERRLFKLIGSMFLLTTAFTLFMLFGLATPQEHTIICKLDAIFCNNFYYFSLTSAVFAVCIECFTIVSCIFMIGTLQRNRRKMLQVAPATNQDSNSGNQQVQGGRSQDTQSVKRTAEMRSTVTITLIILVFVICVTPINVGFLLQGLHLVETTSRTTRHVFMTLTCMNSAINPFIYCFRTPEVRKTLRAWLSNCRSLFLE